MSDTASKPAADLPAFLKKHVRPYDPATDDYERPPFAADIKEGKNDPIYNAHSYHTKVPPRSIIPYILHYTQPGDLVLDVFCGSGMTGVAAQMCAQPPADLLEQFPELKERVGTRTCLLNDLSPAACHIAYNYNAPVDVGALHREFERIRTAVAEEFAWLYGTEHYEPAVGGYEPVQPDVAARLKNPPAGLLPSKLLDAPERTWELLTREQVEERLGYPVTEVPRDDAWGDLDLTKAKKWVCIPATIQYTIWSDVYKCEGFVTIEEPTGKISTRGKNAGKAATGKKRVARGCGGEIVLWDVAVDDPTGSVADDFACPTCAQRWTKYDLDYLRADPVFVAIDFATPQDLVKRRYRRISIPERRRIVEIGAEPNPHWYPDDEIYPYRELMSMGVTKHGVSRISDFYTRRNLRALARLWAETKGSIHERPLKFVLTSLFGRIERTTRYKFRRGGNSSLSGLLYIGSITVEDNILRQLETKLRQVADGLRRLAAISRGRAQCFVNRGSADELTWLQDSSVDYIFTDPPFGGNIFYADASMLYEAWLGEVTNVWKEMVYHRRSKQQRERDGFVFKTVETYESDMAGAFREMFRVLKPGRWATIEFNNSDGIVFEAIKRGVRAAGFEIVNMLLLDKEQKTFKQLQGAEGQDVVDKDVLFNLHKPAAIRRELREEDRDLEQQVAEAVRQHLATLPQRIALEPAKYSDDHRTTSTINSMLMNTLIPRGVSVERLNLPFIERVCGRFFRKIGHRWYLRGEAVGGNGGELVSEEAAVTDELSAIAWLRQKLHASPKLIGELKPHWMKATGVLPAALSQSLVLETLLRENFWRDAESNRWREPTPEEREKINDDRALRVLHDADRLAAGTLGRTPASRELCEWIAVLFDTCKELAEGDATAETHPGFDVTEAYQLIVKLSHRLTPEGLEPGTFSAAQKQVRVAGQRLAAAAENSEVAAPKRKRRPDDDKQTVFEF